MTKKRNPVMESVKKSIHENKKYVILMILCITGSILTSLIPPLVLEKGVNLIAKNKNIPMTLAIFYLCMIVLADILESAQGASITIFGQKLTHGLRSSLCEKLNRLETNYFTSHDSGQIASIFVNDADTIDALYSNGVIGMMADSLKIISILFIIFTKSLGLGIILLFITPFLFWLTRLFQKNTLQAQRENRTAIAKVNNHIPETIRNIRMIHVFQKENYMEEQYDQYISESYNAINRSNVYDSIYSPIILITQAVIIAIMMIGASKGHTMQNLFGLNVGSAVAVIAYVGKIFSPLESIGMEIQNIQSAIAGIKNINAFLKEKEITTYSKNSDANTEGIVFENVTFGYKEENLILKNYSLTIHQGENVTFIGRTGAGKSTIFRLLTGLYSPQKGNIKINGLNPITLDPREKRKILGLVEQKFTIVPGTIRDQITLYDSSITDEMVQKALETTQLLNVVNGMENGLDTTMKEGLFSQGQLQLLAISRAIVTSPKILLLDEITANLDSETEAMILSALKKASEKRTILSISHRYSTLMKKERIIQVGNE